MAELTRPRRTALFLPASSPRAIAKARGLACDVVVLDLEDAVAPPHDKALARRQAAAAMADGGWNGRELVVRINAVGSAWWQEDLAAIGMADAVLVPKADTDALAAVAGRFTGRIWAMVETARAVLELPRLAALPGLAALVVGTNDLSRDLRCVPGPDRLPLQPLLMQTVAAARAHGLVALDGVFNGLDDAEGLAAECAQGVRFGFDGKSLIHPSQIPVAQAAFTPTPDAVAAARALIDGWHAAGGDTAGVVRLGGRMVERLHVDEASALIARAGPAGRQEDGAREP